MSSTPLTAAALAAADELPEWLAAALRAKGSAEGRRRFAPELSYGRHEGPAPTSARRAAVMVLLYRRQSRWHVPLTVRPTTLEHHAGQISLPGGTLEPNESTRNAALRELSEELGIGGSVDVLGRLGNCYVFASDFVVTPWVACAPSEPSWEPDPGEVQRVIELPIDVLLEPGSCGTIAIQRGPVVFHAPCYWIESDYVWGATSVILGQFADVLLRIVERR